jgi:MFS family permease
VLAFARTNRVTLAAHYSAFSISSAMGFGTVAWVPTFFVRVHHWQIHDIGYVYGLMVALLGGAGVVAGARFAEWLGRKGYTDACFRAPMISMSIAAVPAVLAMVVSDTRLGLGLLAVATFLGSFPVAPIIVALQTISPNQMRGQIVSFYLFLANILGVGLGPTVVAFLTDYLFRDERAVGWSIALLTAVVTPVVVVILSLGLRSYRQSVAAAAVWSGALSENVPSLRAAAISPESAVS